MEQETTKGSNMILGIIYRGNDGKMSFGMEIPEGTNPAYADSFARYFFSLGSSPLCVHNQSIDTCQFSSPQNRNQDEDRRTDECQNAPSFSKNDCFANGTEKNWSGIFKTSLQNRLDPAVEAALANIVEGLRHDWCARMAFYWGDITRICKVASTRDSFDQRIFFLLRDGFAQFSQFLCFFEYFFLQGKYRDLSVDELIAELEKGRNRYLGEAGRSYRFDYSDGAADPGQDACSGCDDSGRVHF